ncbi:MAG: protein kinase domain-containing protein [Planctomycetota bacterium]
MPRDYRAGDEIVPGHRLAVFLGRGGVGEVWRARGPGGTDVALKVIDLAGIEGRKEFRALRLVMRIRHPNLVPVHAVWLKGHDGKILDLDLHGNETGTFEGGAVDALATTRAELHSTAATELIYAMGMGDQSLFALMQSCRTKGLEGIPRDELLNYLEEAAKAIDYLGSPTHELGSGPVAIHHGDIKPQNILIVGNSVEVCDFGLARVISASRSTSSAGTIAYASPESLEGNPGPTSDQYSLAISYYEVLTGVLPYREQTIAAVIERALDFSRVTAAEQAVLNRAVARDPRQRYPSAVAMVRALRGAAEVAAPPRRRFPAALVAGLAVFALIAAGWYFVNTFMLHGNPISLDATAKRNAASSPLAVRDGETAFQLGASALQEKQYDWAIQYFERAGQLDPRFARLPEIAKAYLERGSQYLGNQDPERALEDFRKGIECDDRDPRLFGRAGAASYLLQNWSDTVKYCSAAIKLAPDDRTLINRGRAYRKLEQLDLAMSDFAEAARLNPGCADAHYLLGECYLMKEDYLAAVDSYGKAIEFSDSTEASLCDRTKAHFFRGSLLLALGNLDEAETDLLQVVSHEGELEAVDEIYAQLAEAFHKAGKSSPATRWLREAIRLAPDNSEYQRRSEVYCAVPKK